MRVFLTGAEGMIGSHLKTFLESTGWEVDTFVGDITSEEDWANHASENLLDEDLKILQFEEVIIENFRYLVGERTVL